MSLIFKLTLLAAVAFEPQVVFGVTIKVPMDRPTIQSGIDAAVAGDVVLVAAGIYAENLVMKSGVVLESESGSSVTMIDGAGSGSVIRCIGVSSATTIRGFHITNGTGNPEFNGAYGGGIQCRDGSSPLIEGNEFSNNTATYGGAIGCRFGSVPVIRDNDIHDNLAKREGGGVYAIDGGSGFLTVVGNTFRKNSADPMAGAGGGIWIGGINADLLNNVIHECNSGNAGGAIWAGFDGWKRIMGNVLYDNFCMNLGGGLWVNAGTTTIEHNTFHGNAAPFGGAIATGASGSKLIRYNILASSPQGQGFHCTAPDGATTVSCNDIWGNASGDAICGMDAGDNLSADPLFCDPDHGVFALRFGSPALPANKSCGVLIGALDKACGTPADGPAPTLLNALYPGQPNPFNPMTTIRFDLAQGGLVSLTIFDVQGARVRSLIQREMAVGRQRVVWDGEDDHGRAVSSGTYFCLLTTTGFHAHTRLTLVR